MRRSYIGIIIPLSCLLIIAVIVVVLFHRDSSDTARNDSSDQSGSQAVQDSASISNSNPQSLLDDTTTRVAWTAVKIEDVVASSVPKYKEDVVGAELVRLASDMHDWQQKDTVQIHLPQTGEMFSVQIEQVITSLGTNRSYKAKIRENNHEFSLLITVGKKNVFANFTTSKGSFELVGNTQYAWLMPIENMDQHVDYSVDDYDIVPEQLHHKPEHQDEHR
ncbi:MAG: hypothetical protein F4W92_03810 [Gammaproteobacteria bacterium]|nr:hypothetical protein [Gammaproteobacteria bacterium]